MERMRVTNRPVRRDLWPDLSAMRRTVADEEANDVSALLRMIPNGDLVGDEWGIIELNARMGESIQLDAARLIAEARETVRVPDGIPVVNIQFDREMMSDIRSDSVEETIKQGPNGVYYIPKPAYFVHIDDSVTEFSDLESAKSMYASTTGESDVVVFYPVVDVEEQDLDGTVANETPEYVSALYLTVQHELQRALETHDDPLF
jgi:hypothetical protein